MPPPWLATSCSMITASVTPRPAPPYSGGIVMPSQPASAIARWNSRGNSPSSSRASQYSSSNERTTALTPSRIARWSSLMEKSMASPSSGAAQPARPSVRRACVRWGLSTITPSMLSVPASGCAAKASTMRRACGELGLGRRVGLVDDGHLVGVDRDAPAKTAPARSPARSGEAGGIAEVGVQRVDRRHAGGRGGAQAQRIGERVQRRPAAVFLAVGDGADRGRQVLGAPGHAGQSRHRAGEALHVEHRLRASRWPPARCAPCPARCRRAPPARRGSGPGARRRRRHGSWAAGCRPGPARTTAARSSIARPVSSGLMRTKSRDASCAACAAMNSAAMPRATALRASATASSRSRISTSAGLPIDLASLRSLSAGTKSIERELHARLPAASAPGAGRCRPPRRAG